MELKEFIKQTIIQITEGIREGNKYIKDNKFGEGVNDDNYETIDFDIAVTSNEEETTGIGGKIFVANLFSAGAKDETTTKASNASRIKFKIFLNVKTKS